MGYGCDADVAGEGIFVLEPLYAGDLGHNLGRGQITAAGKAAAAMTIRKSAFRKGPQALHKPGRKALRYAVNGLWVGSGLMSGASNLPDCSAVRTSIGSSGMNSRTESS